MKILVAEDDEYLLHGLCDIFESEGYTTIKASDGEMALALFQTEAPDFVCLDVMMPKVNGYDVCKQIRKQNLTVPVLFLSAKSEEIDRVLGLELGADDFITKPFGIREVIARIRAITRRYFQTTKPDQTPPNFQMNDITIVPKELRAYRNKQAIELSLRDISILSLLYQNKNQGASRSLLLDHCWGIDCMPNSRTVDQHIAQLRKKVEQDPKHPVIIQTLHGVGYRFIDKKIT